MTTTGVSLGTIGAALLLAGTLQACGSRETPSGGGADRPTDSAGSASAAAQTGDLHVVGLVRHSELEGGFYAIEASDGSTYDPTNLAAEFRRDGLPIEADLRRRNDMAGIHQRGQIVEIIRIRTREVAAQGPPAFANRVWKVAQSSAGGPGTLYVFLGDGTLLITSAHGTPSLGQWEQRGDGLTVVEEGIRYPADVLAMTSDTLGLRIHSPGEPVTLVMVPAR